MKVTILCGGPSSEFDVSLSTTEGIIKNIDSKYEVRVLLMSRNYKAILFVPEGGKETFPEPKNELVDELRKIEKDSIVLIAMHGEFGEDGVIQSILDKLGLKYTGSKSVASLIGMNKYATIQLIKDKVDVQFPEIYSIVKLLSAQQENYTFPLIIKPVNLGSSVGVKVVSDKANLKKTIDELVKKHSGIDFIFQEYIDNSIEISCGCLQRKDGTFIKLPPVEIQPQIGTFYDYDSKYKKGGSNHSVPPVSIDKTLQDKISNLACEIHKSIGCSTYSRSDFMIRDGEIYFLEINTLPGMTETSLIPEEAKAIGINYREFLDFLIENA